MDFETMIKKTNKGQYIKNTHDLIYEDFKLICDNAFKFNMPNQRPYKEAHRVWIFG